MHLSCAAYRARNILGLLLFLLLLCKQSSSQFWPNSTNFIAMATRVGRGKLTEIINLADYRTPVRRRNVEDISYTCRVIANFVANFVAMVTRVNRGKI